MRKGNYSLPWLSKPIMKMIKRKQRLYRRAKRNNKWDTYQDFQKKCKQQIRKAEWDFINNVIQEGLSNNNTKTFWRYIKTRRQDNVGVAPLKRNGTLVNDSVSKAEILVAQFKSVFTYDSTHHLPEVSRFIDQQIPHIRVHPSGVAKLLKNINTSKACGPDNISNTVLKTCADNIAPGLAAIYQSSIDSGNLPADWLNANISCVFKKGDKHLAENYRPISLTSVLCKQLEHIIYGHMIMAHLESNKILTHLNHGFRRGYSCETQLIITLHDLLKSFDDKKEVDIAILDFSKAFDTIPHSKPLHKLHCYGIRGTLHQWLTNFLTRRTMKVVLEGIESVGVPVVSGVPQGTVLGPLLFLCHINDLPDSVTSQVRLFADDCLLYRQINSANDHTILQQDIENLESWAKRWGMRFNASKCNVHSQHQK